MPQPARTWDTRELAMLASIARALGVKTVPPSPPTVVTGGPDDATKVKPRGENPPPRIDRN